VEQADGAEDRDQSLGHSRPRLRKQTMVKRRRVLHRRFEYILIASRLQ
jgi:hypothetical protein